MSYVFFLINHLVNEKYNRFISNLVQAINTEGASTAAGWSTELEFETLPLEKMAKPTNIKFLDARHKVEPQLDGSYK